MWGGGRWLSRQTTGYGEDFVGYDNGSSTYVSPSLPATGVILNTMTGTLNGLLINPDDQGCDSSNLESCQGDGGAYKYGWRCFCH